MSGTDTQAHAGPQEPPHQWAERDDRVRTILWIARLVTPRGEHLCRVRNVSSGGMLVESGGRVAVGERVQVELRNLHVLSGEVRWSRGDRMGVQFHAPADVSAISQMPPGERRLPRAPRLACDATILFWHEGRNFSAKLVDLSQSGCRLQFDRPLPVDAKVRITIPTLATRHAALRWQRDGHGGFAFTTMLSSEELYAWRRDAPANVAEAGAD